MYGFPHQPVDADPPSGRYWVRVVDLSLKVSVLADSGASDRSVVVLGGTRHCTFLELRPDAIRVVARRAFYPFVPWHHAFLKPGGLGCFGLDCLRSDRLVPLAWLLQAHLAGFPEHLNSRRIDQIANLFVCGRVVQLAYDLFFK